MSKVGLRFGAVGRKVVHPLTLRVGFCETERIFQHSAEKKNQESVTNSNGVMMACQEKNVQEKNPHSSSRTFHSLTSTVNPEITEKVKGT